MGVMIEIGVMKVMRMRIEIEWGEKMIEDGGVCRDGDMRKRDC
jgi:hypothetical protein